MGALRVTSIQIFDGSTRLPITELSFTEQPRGIFQSSSSAITFSARKNSSNNSGQDDGSNDQGAAQMPSSRNTVCKVTGSHQCIAYMAKMRAAAQERGIRFKGLNKMQLISELERADRLEIGNNSIGNADGDRNGTNEDEEAKEQPTRTYPTILGGHEARFRGRMGYALGMFAERETRISWTLTHVLAAYPTNT
jgi:hypothetical protein